MGGNNDSVRSDCSERLVTDPSPNHTLPRFTQTITPCQGSPSVAPPSATSSRASIARSARVNWRAKASRAETRGEGCSEGGCANPGANRHDSSQEVLPRVDLRSSFLGLLTAWSWVRVPPGALNVNLASRSDSAYPRAVRGDGQKACNCGNVPHEGFPP